MAIASLPDETTNAQHLVPKINELVSSENNREITAATTSVTVTTMITLVTTGGTARTVTLPAPTAEARYTVAKVDAATTGTLTISGPSGNIYGCNIAGTNLTDTDIVAAASKYSSVSLVSDGTDYFVTSLVGVWT